MLCRLSASAGLSRRRRSIETVLAKCPSMAPTKAMRSPRPKGFISRSSERVAGRRRNSSASYTAMARASCTKMPGSPLLPELSHTT
jgi:hypothetical protein